MNRIFRMCIHNEVTRRGLPDVPAPTIAIFKIDLRSFVQTLE